MIVVDLFQSITVWALLGMLLIAPGVAVAESVLSKRGDKTIWVPSCVGPEGTDLRQINFRPPQGAPRQDLYTTFDDLCWRHPYGAFCACTSWQKIKCPTKFKNERAPLVLQMVEQYKQLCTDSCSCVRNTRRLGRYKFDTPSKFGEAPKPPNEEQTAREAFAWEDTEDSVPEELARQVEDSSPRPQKSRRIQEPSSSVQPADHRPQTAPLPPLGLAPEPRAGSNGEGASNAYPESNNESDLERLGRMAILLREQADEMLRLADFAEYTMSQQILCPSGVQAALSQAAETRFCQVTQSLTRFVAASSSSSQFCQLSWQTPDNGRTMTGLVQSPGMGSAFNPALSPTPESNIDLPSCPTNEQGTRGDPELLSLWKKWAQDVAPSIPAAGPGSPWSATSDRATTPETEQDSDQQIFSWLESILTFATNN